MRTFRDARLPGTPGTRACLFPRSQPPRFWPHFKRVLKARPLGENFPSPTLGKYTAATAPHLRTLSRDCLWSTGSTLVLFLYCASVYGLVTYSEVLTRLFTGVS